jgi:hypothetical protein
MLLLNPRTSGCEIMAPSFPQSFCRGLSCSQSFPQPVCWDLSCSCIIPQTCTEVPVASKFDHANRDFRSILNASPWLQQPSEAPQSALAESEIPLQRSRGACDHFEVLRSTSESNCSIWEDCVGLQGQLTFCWSVKVERHKDTRIVVEAYIDDALIATRGSLEKHCQQVSKNFNYLWTIICGLKLKNVSFILIRHLFRVLMFVAMDYEWSQKNQRPLSIGLGPQHKEKYHK